MGVHLVDDCIQYSLYSLGSPAQLASCSGLGNGFRYIFALWMNGIERKR